MEVGPDADELARLEQPPVRVLVHRLGGDDDRVADREVVRAHPQRPDLARLVEVPAAVRAARAPLEDPQLVRVGVAQRPQLVGRREDEVQGVERELRRDPRDGRRDAGPQVAAGAAGLARDEGEEALGVGVALDERAVLAEVGLERGQVLEDAVVGEQPALLRERVAVAQGHRARRRVAQVDDVRARALLARLLGERLVLEGGNDAAVDVRRPVLAERADPVAVGLAAALDREAVRRLEEPEAAADALASAVESEQPAHRSLADGTTRAAGGAHPSRAGCRRCARSPSPTARSTRTRERWPPNTTSRRSCASATCSRAGSRRSTTYTSRSSACAATTTTSRTWSSSGSRTSTCGGSSSTPA